MLPLLSIRRPSDTGTSSRRKSVIGCRLPFSVTVKASREIGDESAARIPDRRVEHVASP
jgi:hypothetical protein